MTLRLLLLLLTFSFGNSSVPPQKQEPAQQNDRPKISFTFDDGVTTDMPGYPFREWNAMLLQNLEKEGVKAVFFVTGKNKMDEKGKFLLKSWNDAGHSIGNHTFTHPSYGSDEVTFEMFREEFLKTDEVIRPYSNYVKLFRFPYLKEGKTPEKISKFRACLQENGYRNGYVTIDASDWCIDARLQKRLEKQPKADLDPYREFYLDHLYDRALYYENLAQQITGRHIHHTILLHHNLAAALFADDLIAMFRTKGWEIVPATEAFKDPIFGEQPTNVPAGESLIWALAKQSGKFEKVLRYPAEDEPYEKDSMDRRGL
ncbi:MAG TPA: polysaccharide deacetylase family protein [Saprospiraceae bacterium]|nr:polysaccharide deacetylase family protein [Saprospiraceae bacterium]HPI06881.1 polysaccharide deacetylase family protein [Saprospiraceae bacterium]